MWKNTTKRRGEHFFIVLTFYSVIDDSPKKTFFRFYFFIKSEKIFGGEEPSKRLPCVADKLIKEKLNFGVSACGSKKKKILIHF